VKDSEISSSIDKALLNWLFEVAPFGVLATDLGFKISWVNGWFRRSAGQNQGEIAGRDLFAAFPDLLARGFDRYYRDVAAGQTRVLSHRFHKYLIPMKIGTDGFGFAQMQQSARISPLISNDLTTSRSGSHAKLSCNLRSPGARNWWKVRSRPGHLPKKMPDSKVRTTR
jgi:hypothetical protein